MPLAKVSGESCRKAPQSCRRNAPLLVSGIGEGIAPVLGESEGFGLHGTVLTVRDLYIQDKRYPVCINEEMSNEF